MKSFIVTLSCRNCGAELEAVTVGNVVSKGGEASAIVQCTRCRHQFHFYESMTTLPRQREQCGTEAGYKRHLRRSQTPCNEWLASHQRLAEVMVSAS